MDIDQIQQNIQVIVYVIAVIPIIFMLIKPILKKLFSFRSFAAYWVMGEVALVIRWNALIERKCGFNWTVMAICAAIYLIPKLISKKRGVRWIKNDILYYHSRKKKSKYYVFLSGIEIIYECCLVNLLIYSIVMYFLTPENAVGGFGNMKTMIMELALFLFLYSFRIIDSYFCYRDYVQNQEYVWILEQYFYPFMKAALQSRSPLKNIFQYNCIKDKQLKDIVKKCWAGIEEKSMMNLLKYIKVELENDRLFLKFKDLFENSNILIDMNYIIKNIDEAVEAAEKERSGTPEPAGFLTLKNFDKLRNLVEGKFLN